MKADADEIRRVIERLAGEPWLKGTPREPWPKYLFRIDDVRAAASILNSGALCSRNRADATGILQHDAAAPAVIGKSPEWIKDYVRFYFRPRTPTEYRSEGIRPVGNIEMDAHRAVPIVFVFDSIPILTSDGTKFTDRNAAAGSSKVGDSAKFLERVPIQKVFHDGPLLGADKAEIIQRRCAEVLVPGEISLINLKRVLCRSQAELETLLDLLDWEAADKFSKQIGVSIKVHHRYWCFVE